MQYCLHFPSMIQNQMKKCASVQLNALIFSLELCFNMAYIFQRTFARFLFHNTTLCSRDSGGFISLILLVSNVHVVPELRIILVYSSEVVGLL